jgi:hypothetical protein
MPRRVTETKDPFDAFNPPSDAPVIVHDDATAQAYRDAAAAVRQRQDSGLPPEGARQIKPEPAAPPEAPLPFAHVARQVAAREIGRLRAQAEAGRRDLANRFTFGWNGQQVSDPAVLNMKRELAQQVEAAEAEAARLSSLDDDQVRRWASARGVR